MTILMDNGIYRHLRFQKPKSSNQWFDIVTWPGYLAYSGDMGCFMFTRLKDMFEFFRDGREDGRLHINQSYWGEKLEAVDRCGSSGSHVAFSTDRVREHVEDQITDWLEFFPEKFEADDEDTAKAKKDFEGALREAIGASLRSTNSMTVGNGPVRNTPRASPGAATRSPGLSKNTMQRKNPLQCLKRLPVADIFQMPYSFMQYETALQEMENACKYLAAIFNNDMPRDIAQANLDARHLLLKYRMRTLQEAESIYL